METLTAPKKIDPATIPSAMEMRAASWARNPAAKPSTARPNRSVVARTAPPVRRTVTPPTEPQADEKRAWRDYFVASWHDLPVPEHFVEIFVTPRMRRALLAAVQTQNGYRAEPAFVRELRAISAVEAGGCDGDNTDTHNHLTAWGMMLRRVVIEQEREP